MISFPRTFIPFKYLAERETRKRDIAKRIFSITIRRVFAVVREQNCAQQNHDASNNPAASYRRHDFLRCHRHQHVHLRSFITHSFSPSPSLSLPFCTAKRRETRRIINFRQRHCFLCVTSGRPCSFQRHRGVFHVHSYGMYVSPRDLMFEFSVIACTYTYICICV